MRLGFTVSYFDDESKISSLPPGEFCEFHMSDRNNNFYCAGFFNTAVTSVVLEQEIIKIFKTFKQRGSQRTDMNAIFYFKELNTHYENQVRKIFDSYKIEVSTKLKRASRKVLIVEDSEVVKKILIKVFKNQKNCEIVGVAGCVNEAVEMFKKFKPDFITLDLKLEGGTGLDFLKNIQFEKLHKKTKKCILVTDCSAAEGGLVFDALALGAHDYLQKPRLDDLAFFAETIEQFLKQSMSLTENEKPVKTDYSKINFDLKNYDYILIGSSTGGTEVVKDILKGLPPNSPPAVVVQHMPAHFTRLYAERLQNQTGRKTFEVSKLIELENGNSYIAAGGFHTVLLKTKEDKVCVDVSDKPPVNRFKPSVSVLFQSAVDHSLSSRCIAIMLTGMGSDGAREMLALKQQGAFTVGQNEKSCVVYGMPKAANDIGALCVQMSPEEMVSLFNSEFHRSSKIA
jgi:two-component system chemotaxis response regulator CheB